MINFKKKYLKKIKISPSSYNQILSISNGEITNSYTLGYNSLKPIYGGLFCEKIFGSNNPESCSCGELSINNDNKDFICKICGISPSSFKFRRYNFGHINLNGFFLSTLFYKSAPYYLSLILNISLNKIQNILYNDYYLVLIPYKNLKFNQVLSSKEYFYYSNKYNNNLLAKTSFEAINYSLNYIDLNLELLNLKKKIDNKFIFTSNYKRDLKRYKLISFLIKNNSCLNDFILKALPVLPAGLRPIVKMSDNNLVSSDLNELYKRVFLRNKRLKDLNSICFSDLIINNEKRLLQKSIDDLIYNNSPKNIFSDNHNKTYKSIINNIKGKEGFFRKNLLGKRVDFSGRAVIVSGPELNIDECSIPKSLALELYRPFIYNKLISDFCSIKKAKLLVDRKNKLAYNALYEILENNYVLLNRAPTLHRSSIQSFKVYLNDENVIKINPLVCSSFNADFDGDQMAIHIPVSIKSLNEFKNILLSSNNILSPSNGEISILPTQDMILGIYYATNILTSIEKKLSFSNFNDVRYFYKQGFIKLNTEIIFIKKNFSLNTYVKYNTTYGRLLIYNILPPGIDFSLINKTLRKKDITDIINYVYHNFGHNSALNLCNRLMKLGFSFVTISGLSISMDDMLFYEKKNDVVKDYKYLLMYYNIDYLNGYLSIINRKKKIIDAWDNTSELIFNFTLERFLISNNNSLFFMIDSGARGTELQIKQLCCSRGFVSYKKSGFLDVPIINSLRDGLGVLEYFYFSHISRKTLADTALKTSVAGYLTRKLVEVVNNVVVSKFDCKTLNGLYFKNLICNGIVIEDFYDRIYGRVLSRDLYFNNSILYKRNTILDHNCVLSIKNKSINILFLRSVVTCDFFNNVCSLCYGFDLSRNKLVSPGVAVGIIAAQSIGEPGTQLTMRTFHTSGVIDKKVVDPSIYSNVLGFVEYSFSLKYVLNIKNDKIVISNVGKIFIKDNSNQILESFNIPYSSVLFVDNNSFINPKTLICKWDGKNKLFISERSGYIKFENFLENINYVKRLDKLSGKFIYEIIKNDLNSDSFLKICDDYDNCSSKNSYITYNISVGGFLYYFNKDYVSAGDIIAKLSLNFIDFSNITGGLPKIIDLFEAREPKNSSLLSEFNGYFFYDLKRKFYQFYIKDSSDNILFKKLVSLDKLMLLQEGSCVSKGDKLTEGDINPHDILNIYGIDGIVDYYLSEIKNIYYSQGVKINDKHIEIILKKMLSNVLVLKSDNEKYLPGDIVTKDKLISFNKILLKNNLQSIKYKILLSGITNVSLNSNSFISSSSFQNTSVVLSSSAVFNKIDNLKSLKNNIILGKAVPIGTGFYHKIFKKRCRL